jgi:hypothetical protein
MEKTMTVVSTTVAELDDQERQALLAFFVWKRWSFPNGSSGKELVLAGKDENVVWRCGRPAELDIWSEKDQITKRVTIRSRMATANAVVDFGVHYFSGDRVPEDLLPIL